MATTLGERIRQARLRYGMSQIELARRVGISKTAMNDIELGNTSDPRVSRIAAIARILGVSADVLLGISRERERARQDPGDGDETMAAAAELVNV